MEAAEAEAARLTAHSEKTEGTRGNLDAEVETLKHMAALRAACTGHVIGAGADVGALRTAFARVFTAFWAGLDPTRPGTYVVVPMCATTPTIPTGTYAACPYRSERPTISTARCSGST